MGAVPPVWISPTQVSGESGNRPKKRLVPRANWLKMLEEAGVVAGPIYNMDQVYKDPQVLARNMLVDLEDPYLGTVHNIGVPVKLSATPGQIRTRAPMLGEHSSKSCWNTALAKLRWTNCLPKG